MTKDERELIYQVYVELTVIGSLTPLDPYDIAAQIHNLRIAVKGANKLARALENVLDSDEPISESFRQVQDARETLDKHVGEPK